MIKVCMILVHQILCIIMIIHMTCIGYYIIYVIINVVFVISRIGDNSAVKSKGSICD